MKYKVNDKVAFMVRRSVLCCDKTATYKVGYIKQVRKSLLGTRYAISVARSEEVCIVPECDIFQKLEKKEAKDYATVNKE